MGACPAVTSVKRGAAGSLRAVAVEVVRGTPVTWVGPVVAEVLTGTRAMTALPVAGRAGGEAPIDGAARRRQVGRG
jgi:hypothetical protein